MRPFSGTDKVPRRKTAYAVTNGSYVGEFLVYMEQEDSSYCFLSLPDMQIRRIPIKEYDIGVTGGLLDKVEVLPEDIHQLCEEQYRKNKNIA